MKNATKKAEKEFHATRVPTVLIGIGGIGGEIVRLVDRDLRRYDKQFVKLIVLDTNTNDLTKSQKVNIPLVQTSENMTVSDYLRQNTRFQEWFPMNPLINAKNLTQGAGQIRSVSRLGALASEGAHRFDAVKYAIEAVNRNVGDQLGNMVRVMIVGSVCGGTGSGMGIQLPFLIRDLVEELAHMPRIIVRGLFLMPDVVEEVQDTDEKKKAVYVNGYAFLRELNAFYKAQTFTRGTENLAIEHYHRGKADLRDDPTQMSHEVPYDFLFLIEKSNTDGQNIGGFDACVSKAAQIVRAQLFAADMTANLLSSEDNLIVSSVNKNGLNRYCGAGISRAIYPEDENLRYCMLRFSEALLSEEWLMIDREVELNMAQHKRQMATNPALRGKDPQQEFMEVFDRRTDSTKSEISANMGMLKRELVCEIEKTDSRGNKRRGASNHAKELFTNIEKYVNAQFECEELAKEAKACKMEPRRMKTGSVENASSYCADKLMDLRAYEKKAKDRVGNLIAGTIDSVLGADFEIAQINSNPSSFPYNIGAIIKDKHPIVARYILYFLRKQLKERLTASKAEIAGFESIKTIFEIDYYKEKTKRGEKDTTVEDPSEALTLTNPGLFRAFGFNSVAYNNLVKKIVKDASGFVNIVNSLSKLRLKARVYDTVIARMDILIGIYESFFAELKKILEKNRSERELLEEDMGRIQNSDIYVCSDHFCKERLYAEFEKKLNGIDSTLPDEVKLEFYETIFKEYEKLHKAKVDNTAFIDKPISMAELFEKGILTPLTEKYKDAEMAHVSMDIISAIKLEYEIHSSKDVLKVNGEYADPDSYDFDTYFAAISAQLKDLSKPYLSYETISEEVNSMLVPNADVTDIAAEPEDEDVTPPTQGRVLCYWCVNNAAAMRHQQKAKAEDIDRDALKNMFGPSSGETPFAVNDDSFDKREIICYSSIYDFVVENLTKYKKGQKAQKEYDSRLLRVIKSDFNVGSGASAYLDTVHPHLDRHWHSHAYLPMLRIDDEVAEQKRIAKAFLLGVACDRVAYETIDFTPCWAFRQSANKFPIPVTYQGEPAKRSSFYTLYNAINDNTVLINSILRKASEDETEAYNNARTGRVGIEDLLKHPIINGLIGAKYTEEDISDLGKLYEASRGPLNILRVIYAVYQDSFDLELVAQLVENLTAYLEAYCLKMVNGQKGLAADLSSKIAKAIGANFSASDADRHFRTCCAAYL